MSIDWRRNLIKNQKSYEDLMSNPFDTPVAPGIFDYKVKRYTGLLAGIHTNRTEQGHAYWVRRYYWLAEQDLDNYQSGGHSTPMSEEDWSYLRSLQPPVDPFVEAEENKEFIA